MNANTNTRTINTKLFGDKAYEILAAVSGQLSDGMYENSRGYDKYWTNFKIRRAADNHCYFNVNTGTYTKYCNSYLDNPFAHMSDTQFIEWYAGKLKAIITREAKDKGWKKGWWKRGNVENKSVYLNFKLEITVADIYAVYDELRGRGRRTKNIDVYGEAAPEDLVARREELAAKKEQAYKSYKEHADMVDKELKTIVESVTAKYAKEKEEAYAKYREAIANLEASLETKYSVGSK